MFCENEMWSWAYIHTELLTNINWIEVARVVLDILDMQNTLLSLKHVLVVLCTGSNKIHFSLEVTWDKTVKTNYVGFG
jgi:hypothetical protein